jgi:hypothetical protein
MIDALQASLLRAWSVGARNAHLRPALTLPQPFIDQLNPKKASASPLTPRDIFSLLRVRDVKCNRVSYD